MPYRPRPSPNTRASVIHQSPTGVTHAALGTVIVLTFAGCSLIVDADVPARSADSGAGSSQSAPSAGMNATGDTTTGMGFGGNQNGGSASRNPSNTSSSANTTPSSNNTAGSGNVSSAITTSGVVNSTANSAGASTVGSTQATTAGGSRATTTAAIGSGGLASTGGSRNSGIAGGTSLGAGGNTTSSGGTSPSNAGVAGSSSPNCNAANVFCDGFERDTVNELTADPKQADAGKSWSFNGLGNLLTYDTGTLTADAGTGIDPATGTKSAKALAIHFNFTGDLAGVAGGVARLGRQLGLPANGSVLIDFDFRFSGREFYPFSLFCEYGNYELSFNLDTNTFEEQRGSLAATKYHETKISIDYKTPNTSFEQWRHVRLSLDRGTRVFAVQLDGVSILDPTRLDADLSGQDCSFALGVTWVGNDSGSFEFDAEFDNVRIQVN